MKVWKMIFLCKRVIFSFRSFSRVKFGFFKKEDRFLGKMIFSRYLLGGGFILFYFHPHLGGPRARPMAPQTGKKKHLGKIPSLTNIFQMG